MRSAFQKRNLRWRRGKEPPGAVVGAQPELSRLHGIEVKINGLTTDRKYPIQCASATRGNRRTQFAPEGTTSRACRPLFAFLQS
jgi:hypothetical protein